MSRLDLPPPLPLIRGQFSHGLLEDNSDCVSSDIKSHTANKRNIFF
jgi:hypothetical protein